MFLMHGAAFDKRCKCLAFDSYFHGPSQMIKSSYPRYELRSSTSRITIKKSIRAGSYFIKRELPIYSSKKTKKQKSKGSRINKSRMLKNNDRKESTEEGSVLKKHEDVSS